MSRMNEGMMEKMLGEADATLIEQALKLFHILEGLEFIVEHLDMTPAIVGINDPETAADIQAALDRAKAMLAELGIKQGEPDDPSPAPLNTDDISWMYRR